jgi:putative redox protein
MDLITITRNQDAFSIRVRGHDVTCDMPATDGGLDRGPSPVELLAGSLGTCIAMMVQGYCRSHGYDGDVRVNLAIELADDPKRIGRIVVDLELPEGFPEAKKDAIKRVAAHCPIHETLQHPPSLDVDVV